MPLTLIKEDGTGKSNSNAYTDVAMADAYFEAHLYADTWNNATTAQKTAALVMATRLIDSQYQFHGFISVPTQALQWPRLNCPDPDTAASAWPRLSAASMLYRRTPVPPCSHAVLASNIVPRGVLMAACEMARELLITDRTASPAGEGLNYDKKADGTMQGFNKADTRPMVTHLAQSMLSKYGSLLRETSGTVKVVRV